MCVPAAVQGCTLLDLGPGSGRAAYLLSKLVEEQGRVIGVDMKQQLAVARRHIAAHTTNFGKLSPTSSFATATSKT